MVNNIEYSEEELIGLCEAYEFYTILPKDAKAKIPTDFVEKIKEASKYKKGATIESISDIDAKRLSKSGVAKMAYMCLFLK